jgi:hypothetical protein
MFDLQKAKHVADTGDLIHTTKMLYAAIDQIEKDREALLKDRKEKIMMAFVDYKPPLTEGQCLDIARRQLEKEGLL